MNKTPNYALNQWAASDRIQRADFNADNAKIDAAIADAKPKFAVGTYTGDGEYGVSHPNSLTFDFEPQVVFLLATESSSRPMMAIIPQGATIVPGLRAPTNIFGPFYAIYLSWEGNTLSWYVGNYNEQIYGCEAQGSVLGHTYHYIAIG